MRAYASRGYIIDAIRQALVVLDEKLRVIAANRAFYRAFAVMPEETIGQHLIEVGDHRLDVPALRGFLDLFQADDAAIEDYEIEIELPALGSRVLLLSAEKIRGEPEAACEIVVVIDDVTERKRAETALKSAKWHAERANLCKSRFLATASHDLRQPLQTLSLVRGILAKKIKDKKNEEALMLVARLNETADALSGMLDTLLDINQLEAGSVRPEKVDFPINDLLERLRIEFAYHAQAHGLIWHVVPCRLSIRSDPRLLEQMIRNLLSNAVRHTERGKILLGCLRRGDKLRIEVRDTGTGIPREQLRAIFEEFHQLDNPVRGHNRGFGLGLSIVQRLGNLLGHSVDVQSRPGKGSVFAVEVPLGCEQPSLPRRTPVEQRAKRRPPRDDYGRRSRSVGARDARSPVYKRGAPHCRRCGRQTGGGTGARYDKAGYRRRRLQSAERHDRPPGHRRRARSPRSRASRCHFDRRHLDRHHARDHSARLRATLQARQGGGAEPLDTIPSL